MPHIEVLPNGQITFISRKIRQKKPEYNNEKIKATFHGLGSSQEDEYEEEESEKDPEQCWPKPEPEYIDLYNTLVVDLWKPNSTPQAMKAMVSDSKATGTGSTAEKYPENGILGAGILGPEILGVNAPMLGVKPLAISLRTGTLPVRPIRTDPELIAYLREEVSNSSHSVPSKHMHVHASRLANISQFPEMMKKDQQSFGVM
jgi:hypothetical protein